MIPSILWQTAKSVVELNSFSKYINSWKVNNPTVDMRFMDDDMCKNFIRDNFSDEVFFVYTSLPLGIMRADMWRIAVVYIHGGIYSDTDVLSLKQIDGVLLDRDLVLCHEREHGNSVSNFFFAATPKHPVLKEVIDNMVNNFHIAFDVNSGMLVQNFGMDSLQKACDKYDIELVSLDETNEYVWHECHGTWRDSEHTYRNKRFMKNITFFTTFNRSGYELYGKTWIDTFIQNVAPKSPNIKAIVYAHGVSNIKKLNHPQITILDYDECLPEHAKWKTEFLEQNNYSEYVKTNTVRFSHKGFVIQHALDNIKDGYAIWLDGDCVMHDTSYDNFPANLLNDSAIACQLEHAGDNAHHIESGVLLFDMNNPDIEKFKTVFKHNYEVEQVLTMSEPYDGFVVYKSIIGSGVSFNNLNEKYGIGGIQSCPTLTFLHPEIKSRFTHNIGPGGKSKYDTWESIKYTDQIFMQMSGLVELSEKDNKILALKRKRAILKTL